MSRKNLAILVCLAIAVVATWLAGLQAFVGGPMIGLLIGMLIVNIHPVDAEFKKGTTFAGKKFLNIGIILAGATLNFTQVLGYGAKALPLVIFNMLLSFGVAITFGRMLGQSDNTGKLVGGGTSICGGTAIATVASIIKAKEEEIAYAMTAIFLFDVLAAITYPYIADLLNLTVNQFGFLAGTAINDTSSVAAAQETFNVIKGIQTTNPITVKLTRTTMLIPMAIVLTILQVKKDGQEAGGESVADTVKRIFPWFILWFVIMALLNTLGVFSAIGIPGKLFSMSYKYFITAALVGVGFKIRFKDLFTEGAKPVLLGGITWFFVALSTFVFIYVFAGYIG